MHKLIFSLATAAMVFTASAFAASFEVPGSILASGVGDVAACEEAAVLEFHGPDADPPPPYPPLEFDADEGDWIVGAIAVVTLPDGDPARGRDPNNACGGLNVRINVFDQAGNLIYESDDAVLGNNGNHLFADTQGDPPISLPVSDIWSVNVVIWE